MTKFELYEQGMGVPSAVVYVGGDREFALREIRHYAMVYGQDGPVTLYEVVGGKRNTLDIHEGQDHER